MYSALLYAIAQVSKHNHTKSSLEFYLIGLNFPFFRLLLKSHTLWLRLLYMGLYPISKFFLNTFFMFITVILFVYYGIMVVAVSPNQAAAAALSSVF